MIQKPWVHWKRIYDCEDCWSVTETYEKIMRILFPKLFRGTR